MNTSKKTFGFTAILFMFSLLGFAFLYQNDFIPKKLDILIFILIVTVGILGLIGAVKKDKQVAEGFPAEDELSIKLKYKAGYFAYLSSMYLWIFIFVFNTSFPDNQTMIGSGILGSALAYVLCRWYVKRSIHEESH